MTIQWCLDVVAAIGHRSGIAHKCGEGNEGLPYRPNFIHDRAHF